MIAGVNTEITREAWTFVPGRTTQLTYDANNQVTSISYLEGANVVFIRNFTYDAYGNCTQIECVKP